MKELCVGGEFGNKITDHGILNLCEKDSGLTRLTIDNCDVTNESLSIVLKLLTNLTFLDVRNCRGLTSEGVERAKQQNNGSCKILCDFDEN